ncbi:MAG: hypothetical protein A3G87_07105 [Omnitrophica bacterium RIFCSPLOWO2_12_FULL_50_11]|nr:MAG: hypothetical protein A3G87_07105 [Omnitrophica bacterium RIFCSPLOWO2_12_FULL_50_11]
MISFQQAQRLIEKNTPGPKRQTIRVADSLGYVIAEDVKTPFPLPQYDHSAMDGYVLRSRDINSASKKNPIFLKIAGALKAGDPPKFLPPKKAYRIMTGALIPRGGNAVLLKEEATVEGKDLVITKRVAPGAHIRLRGEELKKGAQVVFNGTVIHPAVAAILASLGKGKVQVFARPRVSVIATGSELIQAGTKLTRGKIYDSNSVMISSALRLLGVEPFLVKTVQDRPGILRKIVRKALRSSDLVILIGGISVGDYDYVKDILRGLGVRQIFWKVNQKPGKPIYFGKRRNVIVFGLPGNPASVFTCFYEYVYLAIRSMSGFVNPGLRTEKQKLSKAVASDRQKLVFLKAKVQPSQNGRAVTPLPHQGSHMISSLCDTNALVLIPPNGRGVKKGEKVVTHVLPFLAGG